MAAAPQVLVCGAGSIGRRHITNLLRLDATVSVWRRRAQLLDDVTRELPVRGYSDLATAIAEAEAVVVATATDQHVDVLAQALEADRPVFVEKPVSHSWEGIDELVARARGRIVEVGCHLRADPCLGVLARRLHDHNAARPLAYRFAMGHRLDLWRPGRDYRDSYSAHAERGGGALFDLIHLIDIALWFFGPVRLVSAICSRVGDFDLRCDDLTNVMLTHENGVVGHVQLDMVSPVHRCEIEVMTAEEIYRWTQAMGCLKRARDDGEAVVERAPDGFERNDLFVAHMRHFLARLRHPAMPALCSLEAGVAALEVVIAARSSHAQSRHVPIKA